MNFSRVVIPARDVISLAWCGDTLVDWTHGGAVFHLDGRHEPSHISWGYRFDAACAISDGRFAVIYEKCGTKALLLRDGKLLRELNRSYYQAEVYEYPVYLWQAANGRTLLAHCPEDYCRIDIDDAETGERLTQGPRKPQDFFHSRLAVNSSGTRLLSAGWYWHPWDSVAYYDLPEALQNPTHLDRPDNFAPYSGVRGSAEESSACWQTAERVLLGSSEMKEEPALAREPRLHPRGIAVYDVVSRAYVRSATLEQITGTLMPLGQNHAVSFYHHPKVVSLETGQVVERWEDLDTGKQSSSIIWDMKLPPLAIDAPRHRFAVFGPAGITVVQIDLDG
jgi:hypothetical protein